MAERLGIRDILDEFNADFEASSSHMAEEISRLRRALKEARGYGEAMRKELLAIARYTFAGPDTPDRREAVHNAAKQAHALPLPWASAGEGE